MKTWTDLVGANRPIGDVGILLLSGGMDSTACLHLLADAYPVHKRRALLVDYGQPHRDRELGAAQRAADALHVCWDRIAIADALASVRPAERMANAPHVADGGQHPATVPMRNLILLSLAVAHACGRWPGSCVDVWMGACLDDTAGFVDCHPDFIAQAAAALTYGAGVGVRVVAPLLSVSKVSLVRLATTEPDVLASLRASWSCYRGGAASCGECTPCVLRAKAFDDCSLIDDPVGVPIIGGDPQRERR